MKAQKLGLVLGINMVAACLVLQGCKARQGGKVQPSPTDRVTVISSPRPVPSAEPSRAVVSPAPVAPVISTTTIAETEPVAQSSVRTVKPLSAPPAPKAAKTKHAAAPAPAKVVAAPAAPAAATEYVVKPGDTLFLISKRTNYRQAAILAANPGLNADRIRVGQKIKLPGAVASAAPAVAKAAAPEAKAAAAKDGKDKVKLAAAPAPAAANTKAPVKTKAGFVPYEGPTKEYVVKSGDSLGKIAKDSGISIRALKALNGLQQDKLRLGQKLKVPAEKQVAAAKPAAKDAAAKPAVAAKDEAAKAPAAVKEAAAPAPADAKDAKPAEAKDAAAKPVEAAADAKPAEAKDAAAKPAEPAAPADEAPVSTLTYTAKDGDDLVSIAIAYGISPSALMDINDLKPTDEIKAGQVLKLPANAKPNAQ